MRLRDEATSAWLGRTIGCAAAIVVCLYFVGAWVGRALSPLKEAGRSVQCQDNLRVLVRAEQMYADDYEDRLPAATLWMDSIDPYLDERQKGDVHCPEVGAPGSGEYGYAMFGKLSGKARAKVDDFEKQPLVFDSPDLSRNAVAKEVTLPSPGRHIGHGKKGEPIKRGNYIGLGGGGVKFEPAPGR